MQSEITKIPEAFSPQFRVWLVVLCSHKEVGEQNLQDKLTHLLTIPGTSNLSFDAIFLGDDT